MYSVRETGEHMYNVIQLDGSDKFIILGSVDQCNQIAKMLNGYEKIKGAYKVARMQGDPLEKAGTVYLTAAALFQE